MKKTIIIWGSKNDARRSQSADKICAFCITEEIYGEKAAEKNYSQRNHRRLQCKQKNLLLHLQIPLQKVQIPFFIKQMIFLNIF